MTVGERTCQVTRWCRHGLSSHPPPHCSPLILPHLASLLTSHLSATLISHRAEGSLLFDAVGAEDFYKKLEVCGGPDAREQWERLMRRVTPLGEAIFNLPSAAVRADLGAALTMGRYAGALAEVVVKGGGNKLNDPFSIILEEEGVTDPFIRNWLVRDGVSGACSG